MGLLILRKAEAAQTRTVCQFLVVLHTQRLKTHHLTLILAISFKRTKQWKQSEGLSNFKFMLTVEQCQGVKRKADGYTQHPFVAFAEGKQFIPEVISKLYDILKITYIKGERRL